MHLQIGARLQHLPVYLKKAFQLRKSEGFFVTDRKSLDIHYRQTCSLFFRP
jgi:hypothetical protein